MIGPVRERPMRECTERECPVHERVWRMSALPIPIIFDH